jgi:NDP-sugar pyrophosphorylase family protein
MMNILILAAGHSEIDTNDDKYPLCLTEFDGVPLLERIINACRVLNPKKMVFAMRKDEVQRFHLDNVVNLLSPGAATVKVDGDTPGAACTALLAVAHIDSDKELLVLNANELVDIDLGALLADFRSRELDAGTVTFPSIHPRYSYVRLDANGLVAEASEKRPISNHATAGVYWYARGRDFVAAVKDMIRKEAHVDGMYYICPAFNELVLKQARIGAAPIEARKYHPLKSARQMARFESAHEHGERA